MPIALLLHGSLLMSLSFVSGVVNGSPVAAALALLAVGASALCSAVHEVDDMLNFPKWLPRRLGNWIALSSWALAALAGIAALASFF